MDYIAHQTPLSRRRLWNSRQEFWNSPGQNTEVGCHLLLKVIFLTQASNLCRLHWQGEFFTAEPPEKPGTSNKPKEQQRATLNKEEKNPQIILQKGKSLSVIDTMKRLKC